jgi:hypothetical protein
MLCRPKPFAACAKVAISTSALSTSMSTPGQAIVGAVRADGGERRTTEMTPIKSCRA